MSKTTARGFQIDTFEDANGVECSLQESSAMHDEGLIWLGAREIGLKRLRNGWHDVPLPGRDEDPNTAYLANTRMHLTQSQVRRLLPALTYFAEHGVLPDEGLEYEPQPRVPGITLTRVEACWAEVCAADSFTGPVFMETRDAGRDAFLSACQAFLMVLAEPAPGEEALAAARELQSALKAWMKVGESMTRHADRRPFWLAGVAAHNANDRLRLSLAG